MDKRIAMVGHYKAWTEEARSLQRDGGTVVGQNLVRMPDGTEYVYVSHARAAMGQRFSEVRPIGCWDYMDSAMLETLRVSESRVRILSDYAPRTPPATPGR